MIYTGRAMYARPAALKKAFVSMQNNSVQPTLKITLVYDIKAKVLAQQEIITARYFEG